MSRYWQLIQTAWTFLLRRPRLSALCVFSAVLATSVWGLSDGPLAKSEGIRALTGHQLIGSGNWLVTRLYGALYMQKPPLFYWSAAASEVVFGETGEWVWRLPSALAASLTALFLWFFARRWFGNAGGLAAGFGYLALVTLWSQNRSAEIDALNNSLAVMAACGCLELGRARGLRWGWILFTGLAFGGMLLAKGPAGLPLILGVLIGARRPGSSARVLASAAVWAALVLGLALFAAWALQARALLAAEGIQSDTSGLREIAWRVFSIKALRRLPDVLALPVLVAVYALPVSYAMRFTLSPAMKDHADGDLLGKLRMTNAAIPASLLACVLLLIPNPRYAYMIPPLFCLPAAAIAGAWERGALPARVVWKLGQSVRYFCLLLPVAGIGLIVATARLTHGSAFVQGAVCLVLVALAVPAWCAPRTARLPAGLGCLLLGMLALSLSFDEYLAGRRHRDSGYAQALELKRNIEPGTRVHAETVVRYHPEVFYYAGLKVQRYPDKFDASFVPEETGWYVLHDWEVEDWVPVMGTNLVHVATIGETDPVHVYRLERLDRAKRLRSAASRAARSRRTHKAGSPPATRHRQTPAGTPAEPAEPEPEPPF